MGGNRLETKIDANKEEEECQKNKLRRILSITRSIECIRNTQSVFCSLCIFRTTPAEKQKILEDGGR